MREHSGLELARRILNGRRCQGEPGPEGRRRGKTDRTQGRRFFRTYGPTMSSSRPRMLAVGSFAPTPLPMTCLKTRTVTCFVWAGTPAPAPLGISKHSVRTAFVVPIAALGRTTRAWWHSIPQTRTAWPVLRSALPAYAWAMAGAPTATERSARSMRWPPPKALRLARKRPKQQPCCLLIDGIHPTHVHQLHWNWSHHG